MAVAHAGAIRHNGGGYTGVGGYRGRCAVIEEGCIALGNVLVDARSLVVDAAIWPSVMAILDRNQIEWWGFIDFNESEDGAYCVGVSVHNEDLPRINELIDGNSSYTGNRGKGWRWLGGLVGLLVPLLLLFGAAMALGGF